MTELTDILTKLRNLSGYTQFGGKVAYFVEAQAAQNAALTEALDRALAEASEATEGQAKALVRCVELKARAEAAEAKVVEDVLFRPRIFDVMVEAAEDAAGKDVSFNVVVGRSIRAALREIGGGNGNP